MYRTAKRRDLLFFTINAIDTYKSTTTMPLYSTLSLAELKAECKSRKLRYGGDNEALETRLRESDWKTWMRENNSFDRFQQLPVEIQQAIWQLSLPGPRVLSVEHIWDTEKWLFPKRHHTPNPVALSVCRMSREVALKRYRTIFGSACAYADLPGGDIIYFGLWNRDLWPDGWQSWHRGGDNAGTFSLSPSFVADLEEVTHIAWHAEDLRKYTRFTESQACNPAIGGWFFMRSLNIFKGLKTLSITCGGSDTGSWLTIPGRVIIEEDEEKFSSQNRAKNGVWGATRKIAEAIIQSFHEVRQKEEAGTGVSREMPHLQLVEANRLKA